MLNVYILFDAGMLRKEIIYYLLQMPNPVEVARTLRSSWTY